MSDEHLTIDRRPDWDSKLDLLWQRTQERDVHALASSTLKPTTPPEPAPDPAAA